ncbi:MAG TPA: DUF2480 family protein [Cyclobacteriaceae bacterium]|nr:DUF2480 family protein [Cyclobacteriaceae bacterium]
MEEQIINRVSASNLASFDLEELHVPGERVLFDIKDLLFQGLILKEKDFRDFIKAHNWPQYTGQHVAITCSADAVVPTWAFMLLSIALQPFAVTIVFGTLEDLEKQLFHEKLAAVDWLKFENAKVVVKGCSKVMVPVSAYVEVVNRLRPIASSIMYGEPCSTVPLFKAKK